MECLRPPPVFTRNRSVEMKKCPDCGEEVRAEARICRFCRYSFGRPLIAPAQDSSEAKDDEKQKTAFESHQQHVIQQLDDKSPLLSPWLQDLRSLLKAAVIAALIFFTTFGVINIFNGRSFWASPFSSHHKLPQLSYANSLGVDPLQVASVGENCAVGIKKERGLLIVSAANGDDSNWNGTDYQTFALPREGSNLIRLTSVQCGNVAVPVVFGASTPNVTAVLIGDLYTYTSPDHLWIIIPENTISPGTIDWHLLDADNRVIDSGIGELRGD